MGTAIPSSLALAIAIPVMGHPGIDFNPVDRCELPYGNHSGCGNVEVVSAVFSKMLQHRYQNQVVAYHQGYAQKWR
ncbi:MAG: hypothetical protein DRQ60_10390 [Gammaproteobacteria bacterium]|nr:MAG: hypothetical protein DRQ60_10390 [Gammaproteobacteria bacterium]